MDRRAVTIKGDTVFAALTAAWCARYLPADRFDVMFDRSDVRQSDPAFLVARPSFRYVLRTLKISDAMLFSQTASFPIYGVETRLEGCQSYFDSFSAYGRSISGIGFHHAVGRQSASGIHLSGLEAYSLSASLARRGLILHGSAELSLPADSGYCLDIAPLRNMLWEHAERFGARPGQSDSGPVLHTDNAVQLSSGKANLPTRSHPYVVEEFSSEGVSLSDRNGVQLASDPVIAGDQRQGAWKETGDIYLGDAEMALPNLGGGRLERLAQDLERFVKLLPPEPISSVYLPVEAVEYNRLTRSVRDRQSDYLSLVGYLAGFVGEAQLSEQARTKLNLFRARGRFAIYDDETALKERYLNLMLGADGPSVEYDPMLSALTDKEIEDALALIKQDVASALKQALPLDKILNRIRKPSVA